MTSGGASWEGAFALEGRLCVEASNGRNEVHPTTLLVDRNSRPGHESSFRPSPERVIGGFWSHANNWTMCLSDAKTPTGGRMRASRIFRDRSFWAFSRLAIPLIVITLMTSCTSRAGRPTYLASVHELTFAEIRQAANSAEWLMYGHDYENDRFSPLDDINVDNANRARVRL